MPYIGDWLWTCRSCVKNLKVIFEKQMPLIYYGHRILKYVTKWVDSHLWLSFSLPPHSLFGPCTEYGDGRGMGNPGNVLEGRAVTSCLSRDQWCHLHYQHPITRYYVTRWDTVCSMDPSNPNRLSFGLFLDFLSNIFYSFFMSSITIKLNSNNF
jgi:hypothetical protein